MPRAGTPRGVVRTPRGVVGILPASTGRAALRRAAAAALRRRRRASSARRVVVSEASFCAVVAKLTGRRCAPLRVVRPVAEFDAQGLPRCLGCLDPDDADGGDVAGDASLIECELCGVYKHETCGGAIEWDRPALCAACGRRDDDSDGSQARCVDESHSSEPVPGEEEEDLSFDLLASSSESDVDSEELRRLDEVQGGQRMLPWR
eukprot:Rhum_TRINITY_DN4818_c0_g2::Rhum_TRINITY_DN4818_c0_g2_i1::g.15788::m.15788